MVQMNLLIQKIGQLLSAKNLQIILKKKTDELKDEDVREMLILSRKKYYEFYSTKELTWSQQMAFDRGVMQL